VGGVEATLETITDIDDTTYVDPSVAENEEYSFRIVTISTTGTQFESAPVIGPIVPRIAFYSLRDGSFQDGNWEVFFMNPDGTGVVNLTNHPSRDGRFSGVQVGRPAWSPDGRRIAFVSTRDGPFGDVVVMNADGSDQVNLTNNGMWNQHPSWSPDGNRIAFHSARDGSVEIYAMDADGTNVIQLTDEPGDIPANWQPAWSPDGSRITYAKASEDVGAGFEIYVMNADGSNQVTLTPDSKWRNLNHDWSPDGTRITRERSERVLRPDCLTSG
jgi:Tol biopolymer transport system component